MTDLDLQRAIVEELRRLFADQEIMVLLDDGYRDFNIVRQDLPVKTDWNDTDEDNYIVVVIDDEKEDGDGAWEVSIQFVVSIYYEKDDRQGNLVVANILNAIALHFGKVGVIENRYEILHKSKKMFAQDRVDNFYEGALITWWKIPPYQMEGLGEFL